MSFIQCNQSDPWTPVDGERSEPEVDAPVPHRPGGAHGAEPPRRPRVHPGAPRRRTGRLTANFLNAPERFRSPNTSWEFNVDKANQVLDQAGWVRGADGVRAKDGKRLKMLFQAAANATVQKVQAVVKQAAARAGIEIEVKAIPASVFFSSDVNNLDTNVRFLADLQTYTSFTGLDPQFFMAQFLSRGSCPRGRTSGRAGTSRAGGSADFDPLWRQAEVGDGSGQAGRAVHPDERPRRPERGGDPGHVAQRAARRVELPRRASSSTAGTPSSAASPTGTGPDDAIVRSSAGERFDRPAATICS